MYAATIGGIFKTINGGEEWHFIGQGVFQHMRQIAVDPTNPLRLYLGGDSQVFYTSDDAGDTWTQVLPEAGKSDLASVPPGADIQYPAIAVDPHKPNRVLVTIHRSPDTPLLRSTDYGQTWQVPTLGYQAQAFSLAYHPTQVGVVYAGLDWQPDTPRLIRSNDGGLTWTDAAPDLDLLTVYQMVEADGILRAATNGSGVQTRWPGDPVLMMARSGDRERVEQGVHALAYGLFVPIFFVNIGLSVNARTLEPEMIVFTLVIILTAILGKWVGAGMGARLGGLDLRESVQLGAGMISRGEVGLIVAGVGITEGLVSSQEFSAVVAMVLVTTVVTPPILRWLFARKKTKAASESDTADNSPDEANPKNEETI